MTITIILAVIAIPALFLRDSGGFDDFEKSGGFGHVVIDSPFIHDSMVNQVLSVVQITQILHLAHP